VGAGAGAGAGSGPGAGASTGADGRRKAGAGASAVKVVHFERAAAGARGGGGGGEDEDEDEEEEEDEEECGGGGAGAAGGAAADEGEAEDEDEDEESYDPDPTPPSTPEGAVGRRGEWDLDPFGDSEPEEEGEVEAPLRPAPRFQDDGVHQMMPRGGKDDPYPEDHPRGRGGGNGRGNMQSNLERRVAAEQRRLERKEKNKENYGKLTVFYKNQHNKMEMIEFPKFGLGRALGDLAKNWVGQVCGTDGYECVGPNAVALFFSSLEDHEPLHPMKRLHDLKQEQGDDIIVFAKLQEDPLPMAKDDVENIADMLQEEQDEEDRQEERQGEDEEGEQPAKDEVFEIVVAEWKNAAVKTMLSTSYQQTVKDLKAAIEAWSVEQRTETKKKLPANYLKIIYKGRIWEDDETVESMGLKYNFKVVFGYHNIKSLVLKIVPEDALCMDPFSVMVVKKEPAKVISNAIKLSTQLDLPSQVLFAGKRLIDRKDWIPDLLEKGVLQNGGTLHLLKHKVSVNYCFQGDLAVKGTQTVDEAEQDKPVEDLLDAIYKRWFFGSKSVKFHDLEIFKGAGHDTKLLSHMPLGAYRVGDSVLTVKTTGGGGMGKRGASSRPPAPGRAGDDFELGMDIEERNKLQTELDRELKHLSEKSDYMKKLATKIKDLNIDPTTFTGHMQNDSLDTARSICDQAKHKQSGTLANKLAKNKFAQELREFHDFETDVAIAKKCMAMCFQLAFLKEFNKSGRKMQWDGVQEKLDEIRDEMVKNEGRQEAAAAAAGRTRD
jgi:hypothetical protein